MSRIKAPARYRAGATLEFLLVTPVMMGFLMAIVTFSLAMFSASHAANAAAHAARMASVDQSGNRKAVAEAAAQSALSVLNLSRGWRVEVCDGSVNTTCAGHKDDLGETVRIEVHWDIPNFVGLMMPLIPDDNVRGVGSAVFRNEGW